MANTVIGRVHRRIALRQVAGLFLYCSQDATLRRQLLARQALSEIGNSFRRGLPEKLKASLVLFSS